MEFIQYQYNEKAQERGNSLPRLYEIKISICKTGGYLYRVING